MAAWLLEQLDKAGLVEKVVAVVDVVEGGGFHHAAGQLGGSFDVAVIAVDAGLHQLPDNGYAGGAGHGFVEAHCFQQYVGESLHPGGEDEDGLPKRSQA